MRLPVQHAVGERQRHQALPTRVQSGASCALPVNEICMPAPYTSSAGSNVGGSIGTGSSPDAGGVSEPVGGMFGSSEITITGGCVKSKPCGRASMRIQNWPVTTGTVGGPPPDTVYEYLPPATSRKAWRALNAEGAAAATVYEYLPPETRRKVVRAFITPPPTPTVVLAQSGAGSGCAHWM